MLDQVKKDFLREIGEEHDNTDMVSVVVFYQAGPYGIIKIDDQPFKVTKIDVEEGVAVLEQADDVRDTGETPFRRVK